MAAEVCNTDDVIDSRDVIARIEELEGERQDCADRIDEAQEEYDNAETTADRDGVDFVDRERLRSEIDSARAMLAEWDRDNTEELKGLEDLAEEAEGCAEDWFYGAQLIRDSHFKDYAQELAEDTCPFSRGSDEAKLLESWPYRCIDWRQAAEELKQDYSSVEFDGVTYWVR